MAWNFRNNNMASCLYGALLLQRGKRRKIQARYFNDIDVAVQSFALLSSCAQ